MFVVLVLKRKGADFRGVLVKKQGAARFLHG
jgi:hypothetical protein